MCLNGAFQIMKMMDKDNMMKAQGTRDKYTRSPLGGVVTCCFAPLAMTALSLVPLIKIFVMFVQIERRSGSVDFHHVYLLCSIRMKQLAAMLSQGKKIAGQYSMPFFLTVDTSQDIPARFVPGLE